MHFGKWMRQERLRQKRTQAECADVIGMKVQYWSDLERNVERPEEDTVRRIAVALHVSDADALEIAGYISRRTDTYEAEIARIVDGVEPRFRPALVASVRSIAEALRGMPAA